MAPRRLSATPKKREEIRDPQESEQLANQVFKVCHDSLGTPWVRKLFRSLLRYGGRPFVPFLPFSKLMVFQVNLGIV